MKTKILETWDVTHRVNAIEDKDFPMLCDYCFSINVSRLLYAMEDIGHKACNITKMIYGHIF